MTAQLQQVAERLAGPQNGARRTMAGLVASALSVLPLSQTFTDWAWLPPVWIGMLLAIGPAALLRIRSAPRSIHLLPGLVLALLYLTVRFVPDHAWGGVLPLRGAWLDVAAMDSAFHDTIRDSSAPLASTEPIRMVLAALLVMVAVAVDLLAVVARRPALAGVPFLLLFTLAGAMPRHAVGWFWFVLAALGYLVLLSSDARDERTRWGRLMPRPAGASKGAVKALTARRIAVIAIVIALAIPLVLPVRKSNLLADALHGDHGTGGGGGGVSLDPFVRLKGQLNRSSPVQLLQVSTAGLDNQDPFYLSEIVLDRYDQSGWRQGTRGPSEPLASTTFAADPAASTPDVPTRTFTATISSANLDDVAVPLFQAPAHIDGLSGPWVWSRQQATLVGGRIQKGDHYTETVAEPDPSISQLQQAKSLADNPGMRLWLQHPVMPNYVTATVTRITKGKSTPYDKALAILRYFGTGNGFTYSLTTKTGDSGSDLVDFLQNQVGFCQQYAAAMGIMLRLAGVPARVVVGYTHQVPNSDGSFQVTSNDAHAWVEAYFDGVGWLPFDPTPLVGTDAGRAAAIPWAPKATAGAATLPTATTTGNPQGGESNKRTTVVPEAQGGGAGRSSGPLPMWAVALLLGIAGLIVLVFLVPASVRLRRRRHRLRAAARDPDPLWQELADTAVDLGYVWSPVRTPRQVVTWLRREGVDGHADGALRTLASAVELSRYAAPGQGAATRTLIPELRRVEGSLRSTRTGWERTRARLLPLSLGWTGLGGRRRH